MYDEYTQAYHDAEHEYNSRTHELSCLNCDKNITAEQWEIDNLSEEEYNVCSYDCFEQLIDDSVEITNFKSIDVPSDSKAVCERKGCLERADKITTCDQTNCLWYLCISDALDMKNGEIFW